MTITTSVTRWLLALLLVPMLIPSSGLAQGTAPDLSRMSIEELMNIEFTSASRKVQRAADIAAAVFVITHDAIRRSGMTTIPDLLRLAPGVEVAQFNSNKWAVSVRGFNGLNSNKLLVLVDGRTVYSRIFSGVLWDAEDVMLDDIDRIEVVRGPGAALWGANAVNGVINIVTKAAGETTGALARLDSGRFGEQAAVRYGGALGTGSYRVYSQATRRAQSLTAQGADANDGSHSITTGFRADWATQPDALMLEGAFTAGQTRPLWLNFNPQTAALEQFANVASDGQGGYLLGRWIHTRPNGASLQVQSFVDIGGRQESVGNYDRRTVDIDTQYHTALGARHDVVGGIGYRFIDEGLAGISGFSLATPRDSSSLTTAFLQDEIQLFGSRLAVTLGSQVQYDTDSGAGVQPTARAMWKALPGQRVWVAASRALRTPSLADRGLQLIYPPVPTSTGLPLVARVLGNPAAATETLVDAEVGYRLEIGSTASVDVTGYMGHYKHLVTRERSDPVVQFVPSPEILVTAQFGNLLEATTRGFEIAAQWAPIPAWTVAGSVTAFHLTPQPDPATRDPGAATEDGSVPRGQWQLRSTLFPAGRGTLNVAIFHVGPLEQFQVAAYTRTDINAEWRLTDRLSAMAVSQNIFDASHAEFADVRAPLGTTEVARSASLRLRWTFR
ncbi:MAG: TonB-dependent receptor [Acidobacteriota bacterium]